METQLEKKYLDLSEEIQQSVKEKFGCRIRKRSKYYLILPKLLQKCLPTLLTKPKLTL